MSNIYIPPSCRTLSEDTAKQQIRLGIQGFPGSGKDWSILGTPDGKQKGFPNPIVLNLDRGLGAHSQCTNIYEVPLYKMFKRTEQKDERSGERQVSGVERQMRGLVRQMRDPE